MIPNNHFYPAGRVSIHPGVMLLEEWLKPSGVSVAAFARHIGMTRAALSEIVHGRRGLSAKACFQMAAGTGSSPEMWWGFQESWEFTYARQKLKKAGRLPMPNVMPAFTRPLTEEEERERKADDDRFDAWWAKREAARRKAAQGARVKAKAAAQKPQVRAATNGDGNGNGRRARKTA